MFNFKNLSRKCLLCAALIVVVFCLPAASYSEQIVALGIHPYLSSSDLYKRFSPLADYLGDVIGHSVTLEISSDYDDHIDKIGTNKYDIAYMGPVSFVKLIDTFGEKPVVAGLEVNGKTYFYGFIIARAESDLSSLADLKGQRFAFGDPSSTMSHIVPRYMLVKSGTSISDLAGHSFLGSHDNVALGVLIGNFDAGAVKEETFYKYREKGLKKLATTPKITEHVFVASSDMPKALVNKIRTAMLRLGNDSKGLAIIQSIKKSATGFVEFKSEDYDNLREILKTLKQRGYTP